MARLSLRRIYIAVLTVALFNSLILFISPDILRHITLLVNPSKVTNIQHFSSFKEAKKHIHDMDINRAATVTIEYYNFSMEMPHLANKEDSDIFLAMKRIQDFLKPNTPAMLKGMIEIIPNGSFQGDFDCGFKSNYSYFQVSREAAAKNKFKYLCPLMIPEAYAFQLFLDGTLPKIAQAYGILRRSEVSLLLPRPRDKVIWSILDKLGISRDRIVEGSLVDTKTVYQADYLITTCTTPPLHPVLWRQMRDLLGVNNQLTVPLRDSTVLLLTRAGSKNGGRSIVNSDELESLLNQRYPGQVQVFSGSYDLDEAIEFFGRVRIIIGPHGGAFFNMNFAPSSTTIIEFIPHTSSGQHPGHFSAAIVLAMAQMIGQPYWRIPCLRVNGANNMRADLDKINHVLNSVDSAYNL